MQNLAPRKRRAGIIALVPIIFFLVSGGPFGLEGVVRTGALQSLLLILIIPVIWALPIALLTAELSTAIPEEGGYYNWVKRGLSPAAGFFCAWFTYLYSAVDLAIYPVLFVSYLKAFPQVAALPQPWLFLISLSIILMVTWLNIRGVKPVGNASLLIGILLLVPFVVMCILGFTNFHFSSTVFTKNPPTLNSFLPGIFLIMWNYLGWDSVSTISGEIERPKKAFPVAIAIALPLIALFYFFSVLAGILAQPDPAAWTDGSWPAIANLIGGEKLKNWMIIGGCLSAIGLFSAGILSSSRIPFVLAADKLFPANFRKLHRRYQTPWVAITVSVIICSALSFLRLEQLAEVDVLFYSFALLLEFAALIVLRKKEPGLARPYKIPGGTFGVLLVSIPPTILVLLATYEVFSDESYLTLGTLFFGALSGIFIWSFRRKG